MSRYVLTPAAENDLNEIVDYIAARSPKNALMIFDKLHAIARKVADFPGIGHARNDLVDESLRVIAVHSFLIVYRPKTRPLQIIRMLHGARDIQSITGLGKTPNPQ